MFRMIRLYHLENPEDIVEAVQAARRCVSDTQTILHSEVGFDPDREGDYDMSILMDFATMVDAREFVHTKQYLGLMHDLPACEESVMLYAREDD